MDSWFVQITDFGIYKLCFSLAFSIKISCHCSFQKRSFWSLQYLQWLCMESFKDLLRILCSEVQKVGELVFKEDRKICIKSFDMYWRRRVNQNRGSKWLFTVVQVTGIFWDTFCMLVLKNKFASEWTDFFFYTFSVCVSNLILAKVGSLASGSCT